MSHELHIVSFDIPLPSNYGGVIDVFHKLKTLKEQGVEITLHCFQYGTRTPNKELNNYCKEVFYYERKIGFYGISTSLPYIVYSRRSKELLERLKNTNAAILFEGLHTCYYLNHKSLEKKFKIVRCHNIEHEYYSKLADYSSRTKKIYFLQEAYRLKKYEAVLENAQILLTISDGDQSYFEATYSHPEIIKVPAFHTDDKVSSLLGSGTYSLFHGSLNVSENDHSARYLVEKVFHDTDYQLIIAGKDPSFELQKLCAKKDNIILVSNPDWEELNKLISNAHIHLMHASQKSGLKLKLLKALFSGRHVIANKDMATEKSISNHIVIANEPKSWKRAIAQLMNKPFDKEMLSKRIAVMKEFKNEEIVKKITEQLKP